MKIAMDTSVLFSALYSKRGAPFEILRWIGLRKLTLNITVPVFLEYQDVLLRPESLDGLGLTSDDIDAVLDMLVLVGDQVRVSYLMRPNLPDEGDNIFIECAFVGQADYLLTNNLRDFLRGELMFPFKICTPQEFYKEWRQEYE
jgi:putative PIN family toxin of toxin-antitoxin system